MGDHPRTAIGVKGFVIRERMKMVGNIGFYNFFEIYVSRLCVHGEAPLKRFRDVVRKTAKNLRLKTNAGAVDENIVAQGAVHNGEMKAHEKIMAQNAWPKQIAVC
jgi:hypothetical protein